MTVLWGKRQNIGWKSEVIRNPLRSLLMKIDGFAVRPKLASDVEKAAVSSDLFYYFQPIGTQLILSDISVCNDTAKLTYFVISPVTRRVHPG